MRHAMSLAALALLAACDISSALFSGAGFNPLTTDPSALRLAVVHPRAVEVEPDGLEFRAVLHESGVLPAESHRFVLRPAAPDAALQALRGASAKDRRVSAFRLDPAHLAPFERFRRAALEDGRNGSLSAEVRPCYRGARPPDELVVSVHINAAELDGYTEFLAPTDLRDVMSEEEFSLALTPCP